MNDDQWDIVIMGFQDRRFNGEMEKKHFWNINSHWLWKNQLETIPNNAINGYTIW